MASVPRFTHFCCVVRDARGGSKKGFVPRNSESWESSSCRARRSGDDKACMGDSVSYEVEREGEPGLFSSTPWLVRDSHTGSLVARSTALMVGVILTSGAGQTSSEGPLWKQEESRRGGIGSHVLAKEKSRARANGVLGISYLDAWAPLSPPSPPTPHWPAKSDFFFFFWLYEATCPSEVERAPGTRLSFTLLPQPFANH